MRLIDADELLKDKVSNAYVSRFEIENAPTIEAEPVVHGHWILVRDPDDGKRVRCHCSNCDDDFHHIGIMVGYGICPNCGAKMDQEVDEE